MAKQIVEMLVESATMELPDTKTLKLKWPEGYDIDFKTGQFITVYFGDAPSYKRAYSLSSSALDRGFYEITIKRDGKMGTRLVDWTKSGDTLFVIPPTGRFLPVLEPEMHLICIAGGSGVTPFRAFAREACQRKVSTKITVLYSVRTPVDIIFHNEFRKLESDNPNFRFHVTCTRLALKLTGLNGPPRAIDSQWVHEHLTDLSQTVFYACGPNALVDAAERLVLEELKIPKAQMKTEKWG